MAKSNECWYGRLCGTGYGALQQCRQTKRESTRFFERRSVAERRNAIAGLPPLKIFIGGQWVDSDSKQRIDVVNLATGRLLASIPHASLRDVARAVESARNAWDGWRLTAPFERAAACHRIANRILARKEQIATIISLEQGKPYLAEALPEVEETAENFRIAAEDVKRLETPIIPARDPNKRLFTFGFPPLR